MEERTTGSIISNKINILDDIVLGGITGTTGNIVIKTGTTGQTWSNLPISSIISGNTGQYISTVSGMSKWIYGISSYGRYTNTLGTDTHTSSQTLYPFNNIILAHPAISLTGSNTFTVLYPGNYKFTFQTLLNNNSLLGSLSITMIYLKNGTIYSQKTSSYATITIPIISYTFIDIIPCSINDYIQVACIANTGSGSFITSTTQTWLLIE